MKYLENAFNFFGKNLLLSIPLFIMVVIPSVIQGSGSSLVLTDQINELQASYISGSIEYSDFLIMLFDLIRPLLLLMAVASAVSLVMSFLIAPATYGMVNKALREGKADLTDFFPQMGKNILKFIIFNITNFVLWLIIFIISGAIAALLVFLVIGLSNLSPPLMGLGIVISILLGVVLVLALIGFSFLTVYWFPAMVIDNLGVIAAFKKSIEVSKSYYWPTVGLILLVSLVGAVISTSVALPFALLPYVGVVISSVPTALSSFITIVFVMMIYRDKTGNNQPQDDEIGGSAPYEFI
jgi:hypothetical protein